MSPAQQLIRSKLIDNDAVYLNVGYKAPFTKGTLRALMRANYRVTHHATVSENVNTYKIQKPL
jgi:hypothetical protein